MKAARLLQLCHQSPPPLTLFVRHQSPPPRYGVRISSLDPMQPQFPVRRQVVLETAPDLSRPVLLFCLFQGGLEISLPLAAMRLCNDANNIHSMQVKCNPDFSDLPTTRTNAIALYTNTDMLHCNFTSNISNCRFPEPICVSLEGSRNRVSTVQVIFAVVYDKDEFRTRHALKIA